MGITFSSTALTGVQDRYDGSPPATISYGFAGTDTSAFGIPATLTYTSSSILPLTISVLSQAKPRN